MSVYSEVQTSRLDHSLPLSSVLRAIFRRWRPRRGRQALLTSFLSILGFFSFSSPQVTSVKPLMAAAASLPTSISNHLSLTPQRFMFSHPQFIKFPEFGGNLPFEKCRNFKSFHLEGARASLGELIGGLFKGTDTREGTMKKYQDAVRLINGMESGISGLSDSELRERMGVLKERARNNKSL